MNTLNLLGPVLLLCALLLLACAQFGNHLPEQQQTLLAGAVLLAGAALVIRIAWGVGVRLIQRSLHPADHHDAGHQGQDDRKPV